MPIVLEQTAQIYGNPTRTEVLSTLFRVIENSVGAGTPRAEAVAAVKIAATEREQTSSTFLGRGLAVPHGRTDALDEICISVGVSEDGILWPDEKRRAHLILLLGVPATMIRDYLLLMQKILRWHRSTKTIEPDGRVRNVSALIRELKALVA